MDATAGHKSAQEGEKPKRGATGEIFNYTTANGGLCWPVGDFISIILVWKNDQIVKLIISRV